MSSTKPTMTERICKHCQSHFYTKASRLTSDPSRGQFCSRKCMGRSQRVSLRERFTRLCSPKDKNGCILWTGGKVPKGYGTISLGGEIADQHAYAHRVAWELARGPIPPGLHVLHKCDIPGCVAIDHLFLGTNAENVADMMSKGRGPNGERSGSAKLTEEKVREIRDRYAAGETDQHNLANEYGVGHANISAIVLRKTWKHIP